MPIKLQILLFVVAFIIVAVRITYLYCMAWKWSRMIMAFIEYREQYQSKAITIITTQACYNIPWKKGIWWNLSFWGEAQDCFESKGNTRLWFEITDHWYENMK